MNAPVFDEDKLVEHVVAQRWFGSKTRDVTGAQTVDAAMVPDGDPRLGVALVEVRFDTGTHELYQLLFAVSDGSLEFDALHDLSLTRGVVQLMRDGARGDGECGTFEFRSVPGFRHLGGDLDRVRAVSAEQSNTSLVIGDELIFKVYRRLEGGTNPELELLRFLTDRGFPNSPGLYGWYEYRGRPVDTTLGIVQSFVADGIDGFDLALDELERDPYGFLGRLHRLGQVTGAMHTVFGSDSDDPAFSREESSAEALGLLTATIDEEIERIFGSLVDHPELGPIAGHKQEFRERLARLSRIGSVGPVIRQHGDYHLGQVLWSRDDWVIIDFEGEPARSLAERRRKRSPLRDVAGMLRSFGYAASAVEIQRGVAAPPDWESRAREEFLNGYRETVDPGLLPSGAEAVDRLLAIFELERAVSELRSDLDHRPDWVSIHVTGIERLLDRADAA
jgi:maltokinase